MTMNKELIAKAKTAKTPKELLTLAKENGIELTEESAKAYFDLFNPKSGEMSDEELESVAGGGCHAKDGRLIVSAWNDCDEWRCKKDGSQCHYTGGLGSVCNTCGGNANCVSCHYCTYEKGLWLCNFRR